MFLRPKKVKYRKKRKGRLSKMNFKSNMLHFGDIGLKSETGGIVTDRQIESARRVIARKIKRKGKIWIRVFPDLPITSKPNETRMGKGKGAVSFWGVRICAGTIIFEVCGVPHHIATEALISASTKIPFGTKIFY